MKNIIQKSNIFRFAFCLLFTLAIKIKVMAQIERLKWINFSPYTVVGQNPNNNSPIPTSQINALLDTLVPFVEGIRTFGTLSPLDSIPYFAKQKGLKVILGIWLGKENTPAGKASNIAQINKGISIASAGYADKIIVGSEVMLRGDLPPDTLIQYIQQVKSACPTIPVSCADVYSQLIANPGVINACDFVSPNIYPFWEGFPIECAMQQFHRAYLSLLPFVNGKEIFISESGWKTFGGPVGDAVPSLANAIRYNRGLLGWSHAFGKDVNIFSAFDEPWKQADDGWGLFSSNAILKPGMDTLFKPFTIIDSVWLCSILNHSGNDTLYIDYMPLIGSKKPIKGHVDNIIPCNFRIATYIKVSGGWWTKPFFNQPTVEILCNGNWNVNYATGGSDSLATDICVFLVPSAYVPPPCGGCANVPQEVYQNAIDWICIHRATIPATLTASRDTICRGDSVTLIATGGTHYLWSTADTTASIIVAPIINTNYTVEISTGPGVGTILSKVITVKPLPTISSSPANQTVCSHTAISQINNTNPNNIPGTVFTWTRNNTANLTGIAASGTGAAIAGTLLNTTNTPQTTIFTITASANGCASINTAASVIVNPIAGLAGLQGGIQICKSGTVSASGTFYVNPLCNLVAKVMPSGTLPVAGNINSCVIIDSSIQYYNTEPYVQRHYDIEPTNNSAIATGTVTLYFKDQEFVNFNANNTGWHDLPTVAGGGNSDPNIFNIRITQYHGVPIAPHNVGNPAPGYYTTSIGVLVTPTLVNYNSTFGYWELTIQVNGFSGFYVHTSIGGPLPTSLNYFNGSRRGAKHFFNWKVTYSSTSNVNLILERSTNSRNFSTIYSISADALRCQQPFDYSDDQPLKGVNYYRLKMVDSDGKSSYSSILALLNATKGFKIINISPNPVSSGTFKINIISAGVSKIELLICDMQGRLVKRQSANLIEGSNSIHLDVSNLAAGSYTISAFTADDRSEIYRFVKEK